MHQNDSSLLISFVASSVTNFLLILGIAEQHQKAILVLIHAAVLLQLAPRLPASRMGKTAAIMCFATLISFLFVKDVLSARLIRREPGANQSVRNTSHFFEAVKPQEKINSPTSSVQHYYISSLIQSAGGLKEATGNMGVSFMASVKHNSWNAVLDAGALDGSDYTMPAYKAGYEVFSFEMSPMNQITLVGTLQSNGLKEGVDYTIFRPSPGVPCTPPVRAPKSPHVYLFFAGVSSANRGMSIRFNPIMGQEGAGMEVGGDCADDSQDCVPVVRIDDVIPSWARFWIFKLDVQGHEPQALDGAKKLLSSGRVHSLMMEWWPTGMIGQGTPDGGVSALSALYDLGAHCFDLGTHKPNQIPSLGVDRPSELHQWTNTFLSVPHHPPPGGDPIGAWDDLMCTLSPD